MSDKKIIRKLQEQDRRTFEEIYNQYYRLVFYVIYSKVSCYEDSRDLAQDTFVSLMTNINNIDPKKNLKYYILTIAKNICNKYLNEKNHLVNDEEIIDKAQDEKEETKYKAYNDMIFIIEKKCKLTKEEIEILVYKTKFDMKFREIAEIFNETTSQISSKYRRMMEKIKKNVKEDDLYE